MIRTLFLMTMMGSATAVACEAVDDARVFTPDGWQDGWDVSWLDGRILAVGPDASAGCEVVGRGGQLTPGFVTTTSHLGLVEIELEASTRDDRWGGDPIRAGFTVWQGYNPRSAVVPVTRAGGITSAVIHPSGGLIPGQAAAVGTERGALLDVVRVPSVGVVVRPGAEGSWAAGLTRLGELLEDARAWRRRGDAYDRVGEFGASRLDLEALAQVVDPKTRLPLIVHADAASELEALMAWRESHDVALIVVGASEGWLVADALGNTPVIVDPMVYGAGGFHQLHGRADNPARLAEAGLPVMIGTFETHNSRSLRFVAGNAVRAGLSHEDALRALTATPAEVFGLEGRGVLAEGAHADLAHWTGDPLETLTSLQGLWIGGVSQDLRTRQTELVEAWRTLPRPWAAPTPD